MSSSVTREPVSGNWIRIGVAMKWVARHAEVDPLNGAVLADERLFGASPADCAGLEWALRLASAWSGDVLAIAAGPPEAESMLQAALAAGASRAMRCDLPLGASSDKVAEALCGALREVDLIICGDRSLDRGSGAVPAFLAARLGIAQALGVVTLRAEARGVLEVERRLGGGRRERLRVRTPAVISVEGATASLRRAPLGAILASKDASVERLSALTCAGGHDRVGRVKPYRPRARSIAAPSSNLTARERIIAIANVLSDRVPPQILRLAPNEAADQILAQLRTWGYID